MRTQRLAPRAIADRGAVVWDGRIERVGAPPTEIMGPTPVSAWPRQRADER